MRTRKIRGAGEGFRHRSRRAVCQRGPEPKDERYVGAPPIGCQGPARRDGWRTTFRRARRSPGMKRVHVRSSVIDTVAYSRSKAVLEVEFTNGRRYRYRGVPDTVYEELMTAPSRGH